MQAFAAALASRMRELDSAPAVSFGAGYAGEFDSLLDADRRAARSLDAFAIAGAAENAARNRYSNVLANDASRVRLRHVPNEQGVPDSTLSDYINANMIPPALSEPPNVHPPYIATQAPMLETFDHFWQMVFEESAHLVIMLTREVEGRSLLPKCDRYWPAVDTEVNYGNYAVRNISEHGSNSAILQRTLIVRRSSPFSTVQNCREHQVVQLQFIDWPDQDVPSSPTSVLELIERAGEISRRHAGKPIVVHCSAGVGRTGTFIAIDLMLRRVGAAFGTSCGHEESDMDIDKSKHSGFSLHPSQASNGPISSRRREGILTVEKSSPRNFVPHPTVDDICETVRALKCSRSKMVQTAQQYRFIYHAIYAFLENLLATESALCSKCRREISQRREPKAAVAQAYKTSDHSTRDRRDLRLPFASLRSFTESLTTHMRRMESSEHFADVNSSRFFFCGLSFPGVAKGQNSLSSCTKNAGYVSEFAALLDDDSRAVEQPGAFVTATAPENACRNRYSNIFANEHTRVRLATPSATGCSSDYINANNIPAAYMESFADPYYVATQAPLSNTFEHFWQMVYESRAPLIVMLARVDGNGQAPGIRCDAYWPPAGGICKYGLMTVVNEGEVGHDSSICERRFLVTQGTHGARNDVVCCSELHPLQVTQLQYMDWPDMGVPCSPASTLDLVSRCNAVVGTNPAGPIVVHCSAGVGRTGTFIAIDQTLRRLRTIYGGLHPDQIPANMDKSLRPPTVNDIYDTVKALKASRSHLVQTPEQYCFIFQAVLAGLQDMALVAVAPSCSSSPGVNEADAFTTPLRSNAAMRPLRYLREYSQTASVPTSR